MGLFSRKNSESESGRARTQRASDDDTHALRQRARHRLIGALALVLAAIIIVPMLVESQPEAPAQLPEVAQAPIPPLPEPVSPDTGAPAEAGQVDETPPAASPLPAPEPVPSQPPAAVQPPASQPAPTPPPAQPQKPAEPEKPAKPAQPEKPAEPEKPAPAPKPANSGARTDDGALALALLEGRGNTAPKPAPAPAAAPAKGNFVLQIVALSNDSEAQSRRSQLVAAGVTNAFVEPATSNGKTTYRLRVGPFPTRDAAVAAQTRLRALGYDNSFISSK